MNWITGLFRPRRLKPTARSGLRPIAWLRRRRKLVIFGAIVLAVAAMAINAPSFISLFYYIRLTQVVNRLPPVLEISPTERFLIVAPHPDDETLACGGLAQVAVKAGAQVSVVFLTSGDGLEWEILLSRNPLPEPKRMLDIGRKRMKEAREATALLGIPPKNLYFLGYPDAGLSYLIKNNYMTPFRSRHTEVTSVPYPDAVSPGADYTGRNLEQDLKKVIAEVKPTIVLLPSIHEGHPDHRAASRFATEALRGMNVTLWRWMVHGGEEWPLPKGWHTGLPLEPPPRGRHLSWMRLDLSPEQVDTKAKAIKCYRSQLELLGHFMAAFARKNELVSKNDPPAPSEPPIDFGK